MNNIWHAGFCHYDCPCNQKKTREPINLSDHLRMVRKIKKLEKENYSLKEKLKQFELQNNGIK